MNHIRSCQLLLDEERPEMRQLPGAGSRQDNELNHGPADDTRVGSFGLITELGFSLLERYQVQLAFDFIVNCRGDGMNVPAGILVHDEYPPIDY